VRLYIGNATKQNCDFWYRLPETSAARMQPIPVGAQIQIAGELAGPAVDAIIGQHLRYGIVRIDELDRLPNQTVTLCYSIDEPIPPHKMVRLLTHNENIQVERGKEARREAGIAASERANAFIQEQRPGDEIRNLQLSVVEEKRDPRDESPTIAEGVHVVKNSEDARRPSHHGKRRR
jgi:hypothetical protein